jgi:S1-C subfamily serine protease
LRRTPGDFTLENVVAPLVAIGLSVALAAGITTAGREPSVVLPPAPAVETVASHVSESTVKVLAVGCGLTGVGTGFLVQPDLVMTSAHVLDPFSQFFVEDTQGRHRATSVVVDQSMDVAVLRASGLSGRPLPLSTRPAGSGKQGVVLGFPHGGPLRITSAAVLDAHFSFPARPPLRDSFSTSVLQLQAHVEAGNSGGPFVGLDGQVLGVVFSRATALADVAYAVRSDRLIQQVQEAQQRPDVRPVPTSNPC